MIRNEDIKRLEKLEEIILELKESAEKGAIILVEGRKDAKSLQRLGISGDIRFSSQQPLLEIADLLSKNGNEIILLTDWDKEGDALESKIIKHLSVHGVVPSTDIRSKLRALSKKRIKDIESLNNYVNKLRFESHGILQF